MKTKKIYWGNWHVFKCNTCYEMERREYEDEAEYWDDFFDHKLKPIKYKLVKATKKQEVKMKGDEKI